jgi:hypothetical protein
MTYMKSKFAFSLLLVIIFLFPGCYTILRVADATETASLQPVPITQPRVEYIPVYFPDPVPEPAPQPPHYLPPAPYIPDGPSPTPPSSGDRREIQTGRGSVNSNPEPVGNNENTTRDSGAQRGRH